MPNLTSEAFRTLIRQRRMVASKHQGHSNHRWANPCWRSYRNSQKISLASISFWMIFWWILTSAATHIDPKLQGVHHPLSEGMLTDADWWNHPSLASIIISFRMIFWWILTSAATHIDPKLQLSKIVNHNDPLVVTYIPSAATHFPPSARTFSAHAGDLCLTPTPNDMMCSRVDKPTPNISLKNFRHDGYTHTDPHPIQTGLCTDSDRRNYQRELLRANPRHGG